MTHIKNISRWTVSLGLFTFAAVITITGNELWTNFWSAFMGLGVITIITALGILLLALSSNKKRLAITGFTAFIVGMGSYVLGFVGSAMNI